MYLFMLFLKIFLMYLYILAQVHKAFLCCSFLFSSQQNNSLASHVLIYFHVGDFYLIFNADHFCGLMSGWVSCFLFHLG